MNCRRHTIVTLVAAATLAATGCDDLRVRPYAGTLIEMTLAGLGQTPVGTHFELWARDANDGIIRVDPFTDVQNHVTSYGLTARLALDPNDPCMVNSDGNLLSSPAAYKTVKIAGVTQTPEEQALQVQNRFDQVLSTSLGGLQATSLLAIVAASDGTPPTIATDASAADRLAACKAYWAANPYAYSGNPFQLTAPVHGVLYGFVTYTTTSPPAGYDGIRIETPTNLKGLKELWLTTEAKKIAEVDPLSRGDVFVHSVPGIGGRDVVFFNLTGATASGTAALYVDLDDSRISF